jgi:PAS domain S-box-containing protein
MSEFPPREPRRTPEPGWSLPVAYWQDEIAQAREQVAHFRSRSLSDDMRAADSEPVIEALSTTLEHLSVAEEELRTQNEELEQARTTLSSEHERYRDLFEHAPVPYLVTDVHGTIEDANEAASRMLRVRGDRLKGKPIAVFTQDASRRRIRNTLRGFTESSVNVTVMLNITNRRGAVRRVEATISAGRDVRGRIIELRWLLVDQTRHARRERTQRAQAEQLELLVAERTAELQNAQHLKDQLVATVSHEFRTALAAIGGYAEMLELGIRGPLTEPQRADVARIHRANDHLAHIVDDLLSYTRLAARQLQLDVGDVSLADALRTLGDLVGPQAREKRMVLEIAPLPDDMFVRADGERLRQIVLNLLGNAVKFTPVGGHIRLDWRADPREVFVAVCDSGPGIPAEQREAIFEPFVRLQQHRSASGTGLGLAISRNLARAMDGDLTVEPLETGGSRFVLRLARSTAFAKALGAD